jgi:DNA-directed RNA polymerase specialized sigma subunit
LSEEQKNKISKSLNKYYENNEHWCEGTNHSEERKEQISESVEEWHKENETPAIFYTHTEEDIKKMSEASKKRWEEKGATEKMLEACRENLPTGEEMRGSKNGFSKLNEQAVKVIKWFLKKGRTQKKISNIYGVSKSTIGMIARRKTWTHVEAPGAA